MLELKSDMSGEHQIGGRGEEEHMESKRGIRNTGDNI